MKKIMFAVLTQSLPILAINSYAMEPYEKQQFDIAKQAIITSLEGIKLYSIKGSKHRSFSAYEFRQTKCLKYIIEEKEKRLKIVKNRLNYLDKQRLDVEGHVDKFKNNVYNTPIPILRNKVSLTNKGYIKVKGEKFYTPLVKAFIQNQDHMVSSIADHEERHKEKLTTEHLKNVKAYYLKKMDEKLGEIEIKCSIARYLMALHHSEKNHFLGEYNNLQDGIAEDKKNLVSTKYDKTYCETLPYEICKVKPNHSNSCDSKSRHGIACHSKPRFIKIRRLRLRTVKLFRSKSFLKQFCQDKSCDFIV